ncbi:MAG: hypothetical protein J0L84_19475 [Verrucomicrobia bacterium]|nr:hypothetical protein [Verrucomicrobiota bacterium]
MISGEVWAHLDCVAAGPALNMAWDEALLERAGERQCPVFRSYGWTEPCATFGYFQRWADVSRWTDQRPLVRRPTGGGLVSHAQDWTYSLAVPPSHAWYGWSAVESYQCLHRWIQAAFDRLGVVTELAPCCQPEGPGRCFIGAEKFDLLWRGGKVAGAAQRRNRLGLLIQGSIQPPPDGLPRAAWESAMRMAASEGAGVRWEPLKPGLVLEQRVTDLATTKYASEDYRRLR